MQICCRRSFLPVLFFLCSANLLLSQNVARDSRALTIVGIAISSMGATTSASAIQSCVLTGVSESDSNPNLRKEFTWTIAGNEFRFDLSRSKGTGFLVSGHGNPASVFNGKVTLLKESLARANLPFYLPALLLSKELASSKYAMNYMGTASVNGRQAVHIQTVEISDEIAALVTPQDWYFDLSTGLPLRVKFRIPPNENPKQWTSGTYDFSNFRNVDGILTPFQISFSGPSLPSRTIRINSIAFNTGVSPSVFDTPTGDHQ